MQMMVHITMVDPRKTKTKITINGWYLWYCKTKDLMVSMQVVVDL